MLRFVFGFCLVAIACAQEAAISTLTSGDAKGTVYFNKTSDGILITGFISGLTEGDHGFHIHSFGDLTNGCTSTGSHFNPHNVNHGGPNSSVRHVGDLGNINANSSGIATIDILDSIISLSGEHSIIGRAVLVHADPDDLGLGGYEDSLTTGHAGARVGCGVVGILAESESSGSPRIVNSLFSIVLTSIVVAGRLVF
ncbi:superoxide dismutase [Cu-Zn]-like [Sitophilus oryzae]|uniref:Superoxide dismutase [Cu-Zn] n=1 Tax=Sitophilus oryzae TaxID=7048 RepID=A0A6J2YN43_SITOR|nr:superoxide dismutase [Cu-Zn]-like [Sitophilus oryzae]